MNTSHTPRTRLPEQDAIDAMVAASGRERARLINDFMASKMTVFDGIARHLCRKSSLDPLRHSDDVSSIVKIYCLEFLHAVLEDPSKMMKVTSFDGYISVQSRPRVRTYADSAASGDRPSGAVALARRQRELAKTRAALRSELDREPTDVEIVQTTNDRMRRLRKDAERQSMISTVADLQAVATVPLYEQDNDIPYEMEDGVLGPGEAKRLIEAVVAKAHVLNPKLAQVIDTWLSGLYDPVVAGPRDVNDVAQMTGLTPAATSQMIDAARTLAADTLAELFGVHPSTAVG